MPPLKEPQRCADLEVLEEAFREDLRMIVQALTDERVPLVVYETKRTIERQNWCFGRGVSKAGSNSSPHVYGLAADFVFDLNHVIWKIIHEEPKPNGGGAKWDTGVVWDGRHCRVVRPKVLGFWMRLGEIASGVGCTWGGVNDGAWASTRPGDPLGWDPGHIQAPGWRRTAQSMQDPVRVLWRPPAGCKLEG